ncbi:hypothetical protein AVEN_266222-1 [Araneus ventricosus]|uniref:Uncharacterized protein n=1 Tax=Araneus ventricosus TaxID=182803 RepID=A0A4Y2LN57_ARAVE|nr:hypothetical protein AVEN_266222-1 [Araneus ventricosus]
MSHYLSSNCWLVRREILYLPWLQTFKPAIFNLLICWAQPFHVSVNHIAFLGAGSKGLLARNPVPSKRYSVRMFGERSGSNALPLVWREKGAFSVSSSTSDHDSELRDLSQDIPRAASKRDASMTKLKCILFPMVLIEF